MFLPVFFSCVTRISFYRFMPPSRTTAAAVDEEISPRPIIKEEDLSKMDDIAHDAGWATHDDIDYKWVIILKCCKCFFPRIFVRELCFCFDYNDLAWLENVFVTFSQKLAFSDDESTQEDEVRKDTRSLSHSSKEEKRSAERDRDSESSERERDRDERRVSFVHIFCNSCMYVANICEHSLFCMCKEAFLKFSILSSNACCIWSLCTPECHDLITLFEVSLIKNEYVWQENY